MTGGRTPPEYPAHSILAFGAVFTASMMTDKWLQEPQMPSLEGG